MTQGRRSADDERQIGRWARCAGDTGRWNPDLLDHIAVHVDFREVYAVCMGGHAFMLCHKFCCDMDEHITT